MTTANIHYVIGWAGALIIVITLAVAYILTHNGGEEE
jgi:hypothetical protein